MRDLQNFNSGLVTIVERCPVIYNYTESGYLKKRDRKGLDRDSWKNEMFLDSRREASIT
jgi:hypothetical protein